MSKKILLALYAYEPFANANTNVILPAVEALSQKYEIDLVTQNNDGSASEIERKGNITVYRYLSQDPLHKKLDLLYYMDPYKKRDPLKNLLLPVLHGFSAALHLIPYFQNGEYRLLQKLLQKNHYDCVLTTCESFLSCYHVLRLKKKGLVTAPWITYFMDPYAKFIKNLKCPTFLKQELEVYKHSSLILTTEEIYKQNMTNEFAPFLAKTHPVSFCNFRIEEYPLKNFEFVPGKINCVYVGSLNDETIRSPRYLLEMIQRLKDDRFVFHMICYQLSQSRREEFRNISGNSSRIIWYSSLPMDVCKGVMHHADILINLGNKMDNQTPSKIFEYISTGRPVVNFHSLPNDTSKKYLERYPLALNIKEDTSNMEQNVQKFVLYAEKMAGRQYPREELKQMYSEYSSEHAVRQFNSYLESIF